MLCKYSNNNKALSVFTERAFVRSGWQDLNLRPPGPKPGAIPGYATPRTYNNDCECFSVVNGLQR